VAIRFNLLLAVLIQGDELQLLAGLASDAAGLLWELAAMHDTGDAATDMLTKSEQLQVWHLSLLCSNHVMLSCTISIAVRIQYGHHMCVSPSYPMGILQMCSVFLSLLVAKFGVAATTMHISNAARSPALLTSTCEIAGAVERNDQRFHRCRRKCHCSSLGCV